MPTTTNLSPYASSHTKLRGPGDSRPTALQIVKDYKVESSWADKTIFITGASSGIGVETAKALYTTGATLYVTARNIPKARDALGEEISSSSRVHILKLNQENLTSVRACATSFLNSSKTLNILILNAGIRNTPLSHTTEGHEKQFQVNHLSHFLLINLLAPTLLASSTPTFHSRVVNLSSSDHRNFPDAEPVNWDDLDFKADAGAKYTPARGYTQSKLANVYTSTELNRRYAAQGLNANAVMPGGIMTGLQKGENGGALWEILSTPSLWLNMLTIGRQMKSVEQGAASTVWAAVATELEGVGGKYIDNCAVASVVTGKEVGVDPGYGTRAFDEEAEKRMWKISCEMVGIEDKFY